MKKHIDVTPGPFGPYSTVVIEGGYVFVSGQIPFDEERKEVINKGMYEQTLKALQNLEKALVAAGSSIEKLIALRVYVTDMSKVPELNKAFSKYLAEPYPARELVGVTALPAGAMIEIAGIAKA